MNNLPSQLCSELTANGIRGNRFGTTSEDVFNLAQLMSAIKASFSKSDVKDVQKFLNIHPKVWDKFVRILNDPRICKLRDMNANLPASYTALYALAVMKDREFKAFMSENVLKESTSSRSILDWTKDYRELCQMI